jgi:hypothetical protein
MRAARVLILVLLLSLAAGCTTTLPFVPEARPSSAPDATPSAADGLRPAASGTVDVYVTFYGGPDNDPPGSSDISYPNGRHAAAGGTGTYTDPITLATDPRELPPGTVVYDAQLQKYFVMEDECDSCISEWGRNQHPHVDLWTAPAGPGLGACEEALTPDRPVPLQINPPPGRPVDPRPLYDAASGHCWPATTAADPPTPGAPGGAPG